MSEAEASPDGVIDAAPRPASAPSGRRDPHGPGGAPARAMVVVGAALLLLGLVSPMMETRRLFFLRDEYSLLGAVRALQQAGETALALVILVFSVLAPLAKTALLLRLQLLPPARASGPGLFLLEQLGRWSLLEVFAVAVVIVTLSGSGVASAAALPGLYVFTASALVLMIASARIARDLDPRRARAG